MRISDWSSDVCSSDLGARGRAGRGRVLAVATGRAGKSRRRRGSWSASPWFGNAGPENGAMIEKLLEHRSEERRVGKECGSTGRYRWGPHIEKINLHFYISSIKFLFMIIF